jgi:hypothetical protein
MTAPLVSVIFPCLNEEESVGSCVEATRRAFNSDGLDCEVIVADNGSTDGSAQAAATAGARVVSEPRRGYGSAVSAGVAASRGEIILTADADGTYPMEEAPALARAAANGKGIVLGSRFTGNMSPGAMPYLHRVVGSPATRLLLRILFGVRGSDPHSGMRAMKRSVFEKVRPRSPGWEFTVEMLVNAKRQGVGVEEIPIDYRTRLGTSKLRALPEGWRFFRFLVLHSPAFLFVLPGTAASVAGLGLLAWLLQDDRMVGRAELGVNTLVVGALSTVVGTQVLLLGLCARAYMYGRRRWFSLERGILAGAVLLVAGLALVASIGIRWWAQGFVPLPRSDHGLAILGLTSAVVGMQAIFSSFFLSVLTEEK